MKYYLAGPMTGYPQFNFPLFKAATERLRGAGLDIVSPAEMDSSELQKAAWASEDGAPNTVPSGTKWGDVLARDVQIIANECEGIVLLPDWSKSKGATLEAVVGLLCGLEFYAYFNDTSPFVPLDSSEVIPLIKLGASHLIDELGGVQQYGT